MSLASYYRLLLLLACCTTVWADNLADLCTDRRAIERVYHANRTGTKPAFEETVPAHLLERLVRQDLQQETALSKHYGLTISPALLEAEVQRINATTRAPEMLAEIKTALGNDPSRFAHSFAKPILVGRLLRDRFDNDDALHAATRRACEDVRARLLAAKTNGMEAPPLLALLRRDATNVVMETTWQLTSRPTGTRVGGAEELEIRRRFGPQAQLLGPPREPNSAQPSYFEDLPTTLQNVLRAQLRRAGDISAVIETPGGFQLYLATERTEQVLTVACLSLPKRDFESWLEEQNETGGQTALGR